MDVSVALAADLEELMQALGIVDTDLVSSITELRRDATLAVRSLLGLSVTMTAGGEEITLTSMKEHVQTSDIESSLAIPLSAISTVDVVGIVIYTQQGQAPLWVSPRTFIPHWACTATRCVTMQT